ncbi:hypothetical protein [Streptococcus ferus]|uniref:hypothetical protein n=1 Tax=Streptococcus ferus TaxID=1345 RepID=UPI0035A17367
MQTAYQKLSQDFSSRSEAKASDETTTKSSSSASKASGDSIFPPELLGLWKGKSQQADAITLIVSEDGTVSETTTFNHQYNGAVETNSAKVSQLEKVGENSYCYADYITESEPFIPGVTGLGGAGFKIALGFKLEGDKYYPIQWTSAMNEEFDYSQSKDFGFSLTKEK